MGEKNRGEKDRKERGIKGATSMDSDSMTPVRESSLTSAHESGKPVVPQRSNVIQFPKRESNNCTKCPKITGMPCPYKEFAANVVDAGIALRTDLEVTGF